MTRPPRPSFFPRETTAFGAFDVPRWRAVTLSALAMGAATGIVLRAVRALALTHGSGTSWVYLGASLAGALAVLLGMLALHLANFPVRRWPARVALFAAAEWAGELAASAGLIALRWEPLGTTGRATWADLPSLALRALVTRPATLAAFALLLAGVVQVVRVLLGRRRLPRPSSPS